jgi:excisionase family DNA binding protein
MLTDINKHKADFEMDDPLRSIEVARHRLGGVSKWSLYAWLASGKLKKTKVGRRVMIRESELQRFIREA